MLCMDIHPNPGPDDVVSVFHLNIRSLRNKISYLSTIATEYDIICITETHLDDTVSSSDLQIDGFNPDPIRLDRTAHGGGIIMYISNRIYVQRMHCLEIPNSEMIWLDIIFPNYSFLLCCVYRPPNSGNDFWNNFTLSIENACCLNQNIVITGDLNTDLLSRGPSKLTDILDSFQFSNVIHGATRFGATRQSLLDLVLIRECSIEHSEIIDIDRSVSYHNATLVDISIKTIFKNVFKRKIWIYKSANFEQFVIDINNIDWENYMFGEGDDIDNATELFTSKLLELASKNIPSKLVTIRPSDKPWFNSELRLEIRKRDRLRQKSKKGSLIVKENYRKQRNHVNNLKKSREAKLLFRTL